MIKANDDLLVFVLEIEKINRANVFVDLNQVHHISFRIIYMSAISFLEVNVVIKGVENQIDVI